MSSVGNSVAQHAVRIGSSSVEPILAGFYPDPSICRVGEDYYLINSSFEYSPGVPIWHSTDLVTWSLVGNAFASEQNWVAGHTRSGGGIFAPTIRHRDGRFWIITTDVSASGGQVVSFAEDPAGPWAPLRRIDSLVGIDPDLAWDGEDCYVTYCSTDPELPGIAQARVDLSSGTVLEGPWAVWKGTGLAFPEAPHLYHRGDFWYLVIAEGGTERGHGVSVARASSPRGPFDAHPENPVLSHRSTTHPVQNTGHADLVETSNGQWAAVYLGVRPRGITPMFHVNGRETFLAGVSWENGWPVFDVDRYDIQVPDRSFTDTLAPPLHPRWVSPGLDVARQVRTLPDGGVEIAHVSGRSGAMTAVVARVTDARWVFDAVVDDVRGVAGILLRMDDAHWAEVRIDGASASGILRLGPVEYSLSDAFELDPDRPVTASIESLPSLTEGPDDLLLSVRQEARTSALGRFDGRYLSTEVAGGFTGRVVGLRAVRGSFRVSHVRYTALA